MNRLLLFTALILLSLRASFSQVADSMKYVVHGAKEFRNGFNTEANALIIDCRDYKDYRKSRIKGASHISWPVPEEYFTAEAAPPKDSKIYVYCYAGNRSRKVCVVFYNHGYRNLYSLKGGFMGWKKQRMETDRGRLPKQR